jgi:hypothetical protein
VRIDSCTVPPAGGERLLECTLGVVARAVVGNERDDLLDAVLRRPCAHRRTDLRQRHRRPRDVRRLGRDDRRRRVEDHHRLLRFRCDVRDGERFRREAEPREEVDFVLYDELLRETLRDFGRGSARILDDDLHLLAGDRVAFHFLERLDAGLELLAVVGKRPGERRDDANLDHVLCCGRKADQQGEKKQCGQSFHECLVTI